MYKQSQISLFLIVGIILLFGLALLFSSRDAYLPSSSVEITKQTSLKGDLDTLQVVVNHCIEETAKKAIITVGRWGGKSSQSDISLNSQNLTMNYLLYADKTYVSSLREIEQSLSLLVNEHLPECLVKEQLHFASLKIETVQTKTVVYDDFVQFEVYWPLTISQDDASQKIASFPLTKIPVRLKKSALLSKEITAKIQQNPYFIDPVYLLQQNLTINLDLLGNDTYIFLITDEKSIIGNSPYTFAFAVKIPLQEVSS